LGIRKGFVDYVLGHASRVNNNWGHNPNAQKKSKDTQKKMYENGELVIWNKGLTIEDDNRLDYGYKISSNKERNKKISEKLRGKKRPKEVLDKLQDGMVKYWSKECNKEKQSHNRIEYIKKNGLVPKSKLEENFKENFLDPLGFEYYEQYYVREIKALYDFKIKSKKVFIEIDGDFWHCNPDTKFSKPTTIHQEYNIENDKRKNLWCLNNDITLLRFWESDIKERPEWIKDQLLNYII
jgi:very-short-patch-repair endonuclease